MKRAGEIEKQAVYGLLNDVVFTHVFADDRDLTLLSLMVNGLLGPGSDERIVMAALRSPFKEREHREDYCAIFDLSARDTKDRLYIVEVQRRFHRSFGQRALYYLAQLYSRQMKKGGKYRELKKSVLLTILDFELFRGTDDIRSTFTMRNEAAKMLTEYFTFTCIELSKVPWQDPDELVTSEEKWQHLLKYGERYYDVERLPSPLAEEEGLEMVMEKMRQANRNPRLRALMEAHEKILRDNDNFLDDAIIEGEERGEARGEERRNREIAKAMKTKGIDSATIAEITGLTNEEIEEL